MHTLALAVLRRRALIGTILAGHVVWLRLLQDNIFPPARFRKRCAFDPSPDHDVLRQWIDAAAPVVADEMEAAVAIT